MAYTRQVEHSGKQKETTSRRVKARGSVSPTSPQSPLERMRALQQALGNQGVLRRMEAGLRINEVNDPAEREADRVATAVMAAPSGDAHPPPVATMPGPVVQRKCAACEEDERVQVQRKESSPAQPVAVPPAVGVVLSSAGQLLDRGTRTFMEKRFAHDFSDVRVHTDPQAADSARAVNALAYTVGSDVVFGASGYQPQTNSGRRLLAHELTHVIQQRASSELRIQRSLAGCKELLKDPSVATFISGSLVHRIISAHFTSTVSGATKVLIPGASAAPLRSQGLCGEDDTVIKPQMSGGRAGAGFPDLARITPGRILQVAEIKPAALPCLIDGEEQALRYIDQGNATDPPAAAWRMSQGISTVSPMLENAYTPPTFSISAPRLGTVEVKTAWCSAGLLAYAVRRRGQPELEPVPVPAPQQQRSRAKQPVRVDQSTFRLVRDFVRSVVDTGADADAAASKFLQVHPEMVGVLLLAGIVAIIALLADDVTLVGIADDVAIPPIVIALIRAAQALQAVSER